MSTVVISGGTGGIGLEISKRLAPYVARMIILGRDERKGRKAVASIGADGGKATFLPVEISTHAGCATAAERILGETDRIDALVHASGALATSDLRTADGLNLVFAVNYLSRYHLTQRLLPALRAAERARVVMMTAKVDLSTEIDFDQFPMFKPFSFFRQTDQIGIANLHYAAHLGAIDPGILAGAVNAGAAETGILRQAPWYMRIMGKIVGPFIYNSVQESAHNVVLAASANDWFKPTYWQKPGNYRNRQPIALDRAMTQRVTEISRQLTGV